MISTETYKNLLEQSPDAVYIQLEGKVVYVNQSFLKLLKISSDDKIINASALSFVSLPYKQRVEDRIEKMRTHKTILESIDIEFECQDGSTVFVEIRSIPVELDGKLGAFVYARDISNRLELERQLFEEKFFPKP